MFTPNANCQLAFDDSTLNLTERVLKALRNSWAQTFRDEIFPYIDEKPFGILYSNAYSRPNTPVNVIIAALILKEIFRMSEDQIVECLMFDVHFQCALQADSIAQRKLQAAATIEACRLDSEPTAQAECATQASSGGSLACMRTD